MSKSKKDTDISTKGNIMREDLQLAEVMSLLASNFQKHNSRSVTIDIH